MQYLTPTETLSMLQSARNHGPREFCMFQFAYLFGLRTTEIVHIKLNDVQDGFLTVQREKGSKRTTSKLEHNANPLLDAPRALNEWLAARSLDESSCFLFTSRKGSALSRQQAFRLFQDIARDAGIDRARRNVRICKHSLGTHLCKNGANLAYVQQALGHRDAKSTMAYLHITDNEASTMVKQVLDTIYATFDGA